MARIAGIDLPKNKRIDIALQYVYGIGPKVANEILGEKEGQLGESPISKELS